MMKTNFGFSEKRHKMKDFSSATNLKGEAIGKELYRKAIDELISKEDSIIAIPGEVWTNKEISFAFEYLCERLEKKDKVGKLVMWFGGLGSFAELSTSNKTKENLESSFLTIKQTVTHRGKKEYVYEEKNNTTSQQITRSKTAKEKVKEKTDHTIDSNFAVEDGE